MMNYKKLITNVLLGLIWGFSFSQNYINYTEKDGLASNLVYRITQDHEGFIWFITDKGISKFDGTTFKNFTRKEGLPVNLVIRSRITHDNRFWYFSRSNEFGFIENDSVHHFKSDDGISMRPDQGINQSGNDISFLGDKRNYHFSDTIWKASNENKDKFNLLNSDILYNKDENTAHLEDSSGKRIYKFEDSPEIRQSYQLNDSLFVILTKKKYELVNLYTKRIISGKLKSSTDPIYGSLDFHWVNDRLQLVAGRDLYNFDENLEFTFLQSCPDQLKATFSFIDKDGFTWCATTGNGVYKLPKEFNKMEAFFNGKSISKISKVKNEIYVGVKKEGVYRLNSNTSKLWVKELGLLYNINEINDTIFYSFGSHFVAEGKERVKTVKNEDDYYAAGMLKYKGDYYAEGCSMVFQLSDDLSLIERIEKDQYYQGLFKSNDSLFSFNYNTMLYYNDLKKKFLPYKKQQLGGKLLSHETINNTTYIGTEGDGVYSFFLGKLNKLVEDDLMVVHSIGIENENSIWAVSEGTLLHYYRTETNEFLVKQFKYLNGYPTNNLTQVFFDDQKLYLGSRNGLIIIDKKNIIETYDFNVYIKDVRLNGKKQAKDSLEYIYASDSNLKVNFWYMNYFDPENTTYAYRLEPFQTNWTTTASGEVNLFDLEPDSYTLQLKVNHNETNKILSLPINVIPRWWQTSLFFLIAFLFIGALVAYSIWRLIKYEQAKKLKNLIREKQLAQIQLKALRSQMNPHFVFNSLAAIQYYINENDFQASERYLVKFSRLIRTFFELSKETEITIENEVALLVNYLDVEKLRFRDKFDYVIDIDPSLDKWKSKIPTMLLQPIVENAINHGVFNKEEKGHIAIKFKKLAQDQLNVSISDDGVGFKNTKQLETMSRTKSSNVLRDRLYYLNKSRFWRIEYKTEEAFPDRADTGNVSTFILKTL